MKSGFDVVVLLPAVTSSIRASVTNRYIGNEFTLRAGGGPHFPQFGTRIPASIVFDDIVALDLTGDDEPYGRRAAIATEQLSLTSSISRFSDFGMNLLNGGIQHGSVYGAERFGCTERWVPNSNDGAIDFVGANSIIDAAEGKKIVRTSGSWSGMAPAEPFPGSLPRIGSVLGVLGVDPHLVG